MARPGFILGVAIACMALPACNRGGDGEEASADPFAVRSEARENRFGKEFGESLRADPNSEPAKVSDGDLPPVSYTQEPVDID